MTAPTDGEVDPTVTTPTPDSVAIGGTTGAWRRLQDDRHSGTLNRARLPQAAWLDPMMSINGGGNTRFASSLPWTPKVRDADVLAFLNSARDKFLNLHLGDDDATTEIGLPAPIRRSVNTIRSHVYHSLSEKQV